LGIIYKNEKEIERDRRIKGRMALVLALEYLENLKTVKRRQQRDG
jgi:hypothetical protein